MASPHLVLASASPRRSELLARVGLLPEVVPADLDESRIDGETPAEHVARLARAKASAVAALRPGRVVVGADTEVVLDGEVLGKPADADAAVRILRRLSGRTHEVVTAVCVVDPSGVASTAVESAAVTFAELGSGEVDAYVASGEPLDKAGAYGVQGIGAALVARLEGDPTTVVGLPLRATLELLRTAGVADALSG